MAPAISPALPLMYNAFPGVDRGGVETLATIPNIGIVTGLLISPFLIRLVGEKATIITGLIVTLLAGTFPMYATAYTPILVSRFLIGAGIGLFNSLAVSLIPEFYSREEEELASMIGFQNVMGSVGAAAAHQLVSWYSLGSICCVLLTAVLGKKLSEIQFVTVYTLGAFVSIFMMWMFPQNAGLMGILAFLVGFFAAGGVMQLALTVMAEFFPAGKGTVTGFFYTAGSIASFTIPLVINWIGDMRGVMFFDVIVALIGFIDTSLIAIRYKHLFGKLGK